MTFSPQSMDRMRRYDAALRVRVEAGSLTQDEAQVLSKWFGHALMSELREGRKRYYDVICGNCGANRTVLASASVYHCCGEDRSVWDDRKP